MSIKEVAAALKRLMNCLPVSGLASDCVGELGGIVPGYGIRLYEPPACGHEPFCNAHNLITLLLVADGKGENEAAEQAGRIIARHRQDVPCHERPIIYDGRGAPLDKALECFALSLVADWLSEERWVPDAIVPFFRETARFLPIKATLKGKMSGKRKYRFLDTYRLPPPEAMVELYHDFPSPLFWDKDDETEILCRGAELNSWETAMSPVFAKLSEKVGLVFRGVPNREWYEPDATDFVYYCHRFLALHCFCSLLPRSNFTRYLMEVTRCRNVEELLALLVHPIGYEIFQWKMVETFPGTIWFDNQTFNFADFRAGMDSEPAVG